MSTRKSDTPIELTPDEVKAILALREQATNPTSSAGSVDIRTLVSALSQAIAATQPERKKTPYNRVKRSPYFPQDGSPRLKMKRQFMQHGIELDPDHLYNADIEELNKMKPGRYCGGFVTVIKRKDGSYDIDYPVRTASQKLKLMNSFGIRSFSELLQRINAEKADPVKYKDPRDDD